MIIDIIKDLIEGCDYLTWLLNLLVFSPNSHCLNFAFLYQCIFTLTLSHVVYLVFIRWLIFHIYTELKQLWSNPLYFPAIIPVGLKKKKSNKKDQLVINYFMLFLFKCDIVFIIWLLRICTATTQSNMKWHSHEKSLPWPSLHPVKKSRNIFLVFMGLLYELATCKMITSVIIHKVSLLYSVYKHFVRLRYRTLLPIGSILEDVLRSLDVISVSLFSHNDFLTNKLRIPSSPADCHRWFSFIGIRNGLWWISESNKMVYIWFYSSLHCLRIWPSFSPFIDLSAKLILSLNPCCSSSVLAPLCFKMKWWRNNEMVSLKWLSVSFPLTVLNTIFTWSASCSRTFTKSFLRKLAVFLSISANSTTFKEKKDRRRYRIKSLCSGPFFYVWKSGRHLCFNR